MQDKQSDLLTLEDLKINHPDFFYSLTSQECDLCENFDMFKNVQED